MPKTNQFYVLDLDGHTGAGSGDERIDKSCGGALKEEGFEKF
jgi:hypothetical protein